MRELRLTLLSSGKVIFSYNGSLYNMEHNAMSVVVDYSTSPGYEAFIKRVEVNGLSAPTIYESVASDNVTFSLERASLAGKTISLQAIAYTLDGMNIDQEVKWQIITFPISDSLNLAESGELPPSQVDAIEALIEDKTSQASIYDKIGVDPIEGSSVLYLNQRGMFDSVEPPSGGYANNLYFSTTPSDVVGYETLSYTPDNIQSEHTHTITSSEGNKLIHNYLFPNPVVVDSFPAGLWSFTLYGRISSAQGTSEMGIAYFERKQNGSEVELFTSWSGDINNSTNDYFRWQITQPSFQVEPTSRMGARVYIRTTRVQATTINFMVGDGYGAYLNNPNRIRHSQLRALNEQEDFQHIDAIDRANLDTLKLKLQAILEALNLD